MISSSSVSALGSNLSPVSELAIDLDRNGGGDALHRQIEASIRQRIRSGALPAGVALPPTRALAAGQVSLGHELRIGLNDYPARDTQLSRQGAGRR